MLDIVEGPVKTVIDGDTFDMKITHVGTNNKYKYGTEERIRIEGINAPEINTQQGKIAKNSLSSKISGKIVSCKIVSRDVFGRLVSKVTVK